jgi:hypothetical protein
MTALLGLAATAPVVVEGVVHPVPFELDLDPVGLALVRDFDLLGHRLGFHLLRLNRCFHRSALALLWEATVRSSMGVSILRPGFSISGRRF